MKSNRTIFLTNTVIIACIVILPLLAGEIVLRFMYGPIPSEEIQDLFSYEYLEIHTPFFEKKTYQDTAYYVPVRRRNAAHPFLVTKDRHTVRIFLLGGSFVIDWNASNLEKKVQSILEQKPEKTTCEIINCGMAVYDSYRVYLVLKEIINYDPDCIVVLCGNNENIYSQKISISAFYLNRFFRNSWCYRKLQDAIKDSHDQNTIAYKLDAKNIDRAKKVQEFQNTINKIIAIAKEHNTPLVLGTVPINLKDIPPAGHRPTDQRFMHASWLLETGDSIDAAQKALELYVRDNGEEPFGYFYMGKAFEKVKLYEKASFNYFKAVSLDKAVRVNPVMNAYVRLRTTENNICLLDLETIFCTISDNQLTGFNQFRDECHIWPEYYEVINTVLCKEILKKETLLTSFFGEGNNRISFVDTLTIPTVPRMYYPALIIRGVWEILARNDSHVNEYAIAFFSQAKIMNPQCFDSISVYKERIKTVLKTDFFLKHAFTHDTLFTRLWPSVLFHIAETFRREAQYEKALALFDESIASNGNSSLPYVGKAMTYKAMGKRDEMLDCLGQTERFSNTSEIESYKFLLLPSEK